MPTVIDGDSLLKNVKRLPSEAFFVDTNVIIAYKDPFSASYKNPTLENSNKKVTELLNSLKTDYKSYTTFSVALEYYKHIQVNSYKVFKSRISKNSTIQFDSDDFKNLKENDLNFLVVWELNLKGFKKTFMKNFEILDKPLIAKDLLVSFEGTKIDFGDHLLYEVVKLFPKYKCIFTNDSDFYSINDDDLYIITFNKEVIRKAKTAKKLF